jgi:hypothetical protein
MMRPNDAVQRLDTLRMQTLRYEKSQALNLPRSVPAALRFKSRLCNDLHVKRWVSRGGRNYIRSCSLARSWPRGALSELHSSCAT